ncbi:hypothetical protein EROM_010910 [Encephalitozoon romaleae SJ-2008]|uniref:Uncharacterized protein n=1 Tax=Encephalitozoon romaleae (strain SJ-2008) TaxID=1178016 RepID=I7ACW8_ENCRO|nr:hypothetical protein EROM_010910 [Encephalitozoon romaleae SJ-2008]AFN82435.1 hypothetical protein EROM_010910 [Encephalitozoon romaleae SJ-2008]
MDILSEDGEGVFDERVRVRKRNVLSNITNKSGDISMAYKDGNGKDVKIDREKDIEDQDGFLSGTGPGNVIRGKVVFKDFTSEDGRNQDTGERKAESKENGSDSVVSRIQKEFEELKEMHRKALGARRKLIKTMEKEMSELKQRMEAKQKVEMENLKRQYDEKLREKQEAYKRICKEKILEYKRKLDEAYRVKVMELKERYGALRKKKS